jgi:hypothetical protein
MARRGRAPDAVIRGKTWSVWSARSNPAGGARVSSVRAVCSHPLAYRRDGETEEGMSEAPRTIIVRPWRWS